jgi:3-oxoacyl-[acyl-carrier-protein] synthase-3
MRSFRRRRRRGGCVTSTQPGIRMTRVHADGSQPGVLNCAPHHGSPSIHMDGGVVYRFAVRGMSRNGRGGARSNWHQPPRHRLVYTSPSQSAHYRRRVAQARNPRERVVISVDRHANTSAASIPLALDEAVRDGRIKPGQQVLLVAVGGGFTWGSVLISWT